MSGPYTVSWTTQDEISWLTAMARQSPQAFRAIAKIILRDGRRWDKHMDVGAIKDACVRLLGGVQ